jgi:hypothetical protein
VSYFNLVKSIFIRARDFFQNCHRFSRVSSTVRAPPSTSRRASNSLQADEQHSMRIDDQAAGEIAMRAYLLCTLRSISAISSAAQQRAHFCLEIKAKSASIKFGAMRYACAFAMIANRKCAARR